MKRLSPRRKEYLLRKSRYSIAKQTRARSRFPRRKRSTSGGAPQSLRATISRIAAPEDFVLGDAQSRYNVLSFIKNVKRHLANGSKVQISFENTKRLRTSGTIVFVAELEKILENYPGQITCDYPNDDVVEQLFQHIGLLKSLGLSPRKSITAENVRHWSYVHGTTGDTTNLKELFIKYSTELSEDVRSGLFDSMSEAITNSIQHAYPCDHQDNCDCEKAWWMFAQRVDNLLTVALYDMGIGIPCSLERKPELRDWLTAPYRRYKKRHDTILLDIAVESSRTSTRLPHRGKGLPDMLEFAKNSDVGSFTIFSRAGAFGYSARNHAETGRDFDMPINGTFIEWAIPIPDHL